IHVLNLSPKSVNRKLSSIRKYLVFCQKDNNEITPVNPVNLVPPIQPNQGGKEINSLDAFRIQQPTYSALPPLRLVQQAGHLYGKAEEKAAFHLSRLTPSKPLISTNTHKEF